MNYKEFSSSIKQKYPQYSDMDDMDLAKNMVAKYPQYSDVTFDEQPKESLLDVLTKNTNAMKQRIGERYSATGKPTIAGSAVKKLTGSETLGKVADKTIGIPEKQLRAVGGAIGSGFDVGMTGLTNLAQAAGSFVPQGAKDAAASGGNALLNLVKNVISTPEDRQKLKDIAAAVIPGAVSAYEKIPEPVRLDLNALANIASSVPIGKGAQLTGPAVKAAVGAAEKAAEVVPTIANKSLGKMAAALSGVSEDALRISGTKTGREALKEAAGKQYEIGQKIVEMLDNPDEFLPEIKEIHNALVNMPMVDMSNTLAAIERAKIPNAVEAAAVSTNKRLDELAENIRKIGLTPEDVNTPVMGNFGTVANPVKDKEVFTQGLVKTLRDKIGQGNQWNLISGKKTKDAKGNLITLNDKSKAILQSVVDNFNEQDGFDLLTQAGFAYDEIPSHVDDIVRLIQEADKMAVASSSKKATSVPFSASTGNVPELRAIDFRDIRNQLDVKIPWEAEHKKLYEGALEKVRTAMRGDLINAAEESGNPQYVEAMKIYADKMDKISDAKKVFGANAKTRDWNAETVISNLFNKNKKAKQEAIKRVGDIFGQDFIDESKLAYLAKEMGDEGVAPWLPTHTTGRATLGAVTGLSLGTGAAPMALLASPKIASRVTLPLAQLLENTTKSSAVKRGVAAGGIGAGTGAALAPEGKRGQGAAIGAGVGAAGGLSPELLQLLKSIGGRSFSQAGGDAATLPAILKRLNNERGSIGGGEQISIKQFDDELKRYFKSNPAIAPIDRDAKLEWLREFGTPSHDTGRRLRYAYTLSDGRVVSADGALKITRPDVYDKIKAKYKNLNESKAREAIYKALPEEIRQKIIDDIPVDAIAQSIKRGDIYGAINKYLDGEGHILRGIGGDPHQKILQRVDVVESAMKSNFDSPEPAIAQWNRMNNWNMDGTNRGYKAIALQKNGKYEAVQSGSEKEKILRMYGWTDSANPDIRGSSPIGMLGLTGLGAGGALIGGLTLEQILNNLKNK